jgi:hypothetical protein
MGRGLGPSTRGIEASWFNRLSEWNLDVYVPEGLETDSTGLVIFGHRREWGRDVPAPPAAPLVRVRIFSLFGAADLWRVPPGRKISASTR